MAGSSPVRAGQPTSRGPLRSTDRQTSLFNTEHPYFGVEQRGRREAENVVRIESFQRVLIHFLRLIEAESPTWDQLLVRWVFSELQVLEDAMTGKEANIHSFHFYERQLKPTLRHLVVVREGGTLSLNEEGRALLMVNRTDPITE